MDQKKSPPAPVPSAMEAEVQLHQALRLMAQRSLHGARGILFIAGSLLLVLACVSLAHEPEDRNGVPRGYTVWAGLTTGRMGVDEWTAAGDLALGIITILCGAMVTVLPRTASLLPVVLFAVKIAAIVALAAGSGAVPGMVLPVFQCVLVALCLRAFRDARAFTRDAQAARDHFRSRTLMEQRAAMDTLLPAPSTLPQERRMGTQLPPRRYAPPPPPE